MPKKGKKSQASCLCWKRSKEKNCATTPEQAECVGPQSSGEVQISAESQPQSVKQRSKLDVSCSLPSPLPLPPSVPLMALCQPLFTSEETPSSGGKR